MNQLDPVPVAWYTPTEHKLVSLVDYHPVNTELLHAIDHVTAAIRKYNSDRPGFSKERVAVRVALLRASIDLLESDLAGRFTQ